MRRGLLLLSCCWITMGWADHAIAQSTFRSNRPPPRTDDKPVYKPPAQLPAMPKPPEAAPVKADIPPLPQSRSCKAPDLIGLWKLAQVFESPPGTEISAFTGNPVQYLLFRPDSFYGRLNAGKTEMPAGAAISNITQHTAGQQQYVAQNSGFVYFYQDSVAVDTQACFIVAKSSDGFTQGQMLLMPPQGKINGRLVKAYSKVWTPPPPPKPSPKPKHR